MMSNQRLLAVLLMAMLLVGVVAGCGGTQESAGDTQGSSQDQQVKDPIIIGTIFPLSGPLALNGKDTFDGVEIARQIINERGGIEGREVKFVSADAPDPTAATQEADRLIQEKKVQIIIGTQSSSLSLAASAVAERNKVFYWEVEGIADGITGRGFKYIFRPTFSAQMMATQMLNFVEKVVAPELGKDPKDLKVILVHEDSGFGTSTAKNIEAQVSNYSFQLMDSQSYSAKSAELSSLVLSLKAKNPDVLLAASYVNDAILLARTSKELGFKPPVTIGTTAGHGTPDFVKALGEDAAGIFAAGILSSVSPAKMKPEFKALFDEVTKRYKEKYNGKEPSVNVYNGFSGAWLLLHDVLPRAQNIDAEGVREAALELDLPEGSTLMGYGVKFAGPDQENAGQNTSAFAAVMQWQDGKLVPVFPDILAQKNPVIQE